MNRTNISAGAAYYVLGIIHTIYAEWVVSAREVCLQSHNGEQKDFNGSFRLNCSQPRPNVSLFAHCMCRVYECVKLLLVEPSTKLALGNRRKTAKKRRRWGHQNTSFIDFYSFCNWFWRRKKNPFRSNHRNGNVIKVKNDYLASRRHRQR